MGCCLHLLLVVLGVAAAGGAGLETERSSKPDESALLTMRRLPEVAWFAPFFSGGGYSSEAISFVEALDAAGARVSAVQHGDG
jgi:hypothetical protein